MYIWWINESFVYWEIDPYWRLSIEPLLVQGWQAFCKVILFLPVIFFQQKRSWKSFIGIKAGFLNHDKLGLIVMEGCPMYYTTFSSTPFPFRFVSAIFALLWLTYLAETLEFRDLFWLWVWRDLGPLWQGRYQWGDSACGDGSWCYSQFTQRHTESRECSPEVRKLPQMSYFLHTYPLLRGSIAWASSIQIMGLRVRGVSDPRNITIWS